MTGAKVDDDALAVLESRRAVGTGAETGAAEEVAVVPEKEGIYTLDELLAASGELRAGTPGFQALETRLDGLATEAAGVDHGTLVETLAGPLSFSRWT